ncbi:hypothetical protein K7X08_012713 [Anisodus acutangulus]|uniref:(+)-lariciresinol reductase n=1 Tax=Anisodus acutangulus TaxID=402998 RepID=A0A9Q1RGN6_9SOLA|nr:hypothetical protein K7X08_012713 [Anisodus acutangulus]
MGDALEPGRVTFDDKMAVRKAIEEANIPFTYVAANCFAYYFLAGLCQLFQFLPARDSAVFLGDANQKAIFVDEDDIARCTIKTIDDPRTLNKTLHLIFSQREVVQIWEKLIGASFKLDYLTKPSFFEDFDFTEKFKMADSVKPDDELFVVAYPYFNVNGNIRLK